MSNNILARAEYKLYQKLRISKLKNKTPTIIANNCNGGIMSHDLQLQFFSPTVNIGIWPEDYLKFLKNIEHYLSVTPVDIHEQGYNGYYVRIDDIKVLYTHVKDYETGFNNWEKRKKRFNRDNLFVVFCDKMGVTYDMIKEFDELPFKHKVIFTHKPYPEFKSACYIKGFEDEGEVGILSDWKPGFFKRRYLDDFDSVAFLNGETY